MAKMNVDNKIIDFELGIDEKEIEYNEYKNEDTIDLSNVIKIVNGQEEEN